MVFSLRIDLESQKGIKRGLPKILDLLAKYNIKASFYLTMGGESNLFQLLKYRKKIPEKRKIKVFSKKELLRMVFLPKDFVKENKRILKRILEEGHELGIHGWKHRAWTRALEKIDVEKQIDFSIKKYWMIFGRNPDSFCSPAFRINRKVIDILNKTGFKVISDLEGSTPFKIPDIAMINVPITIKGKNNTPIIEYLVTQKYSDEEILDYLKKQIEQKKYSIMYIHGLFECRFKINLLEKLFKYIKEKKIEIKTLKELAKEIK